MVVDVFLFIADNNGNIVHKTPIGFAKTMQGARALHVSEGVSIPVVIEKAYLNEGVKR